MDRKCIIQVLGGNEIEFIACNGLYTANLSEAKIFSSELIAYEYAEKHGLDGFAKVRCIVA